MWFTLSTISCLIKRHACISRLMRLFTQLQFSVWQHWTRFTSQFTFNRNLHCGLSHTWILGEFIQKWCKTTRNDQVVLPKSKSHGKLSHQASLKPLKVFCRYIDEKRIIIQRPSRQSSFLINHRNSSNRCKVGLRGFRATSRTRRTNQLSNGR